MADNSLNDDMLKLVRYKILFVKRDYEVAFPEVEELVPDNITGNAFTAWKIAEFIQALEKTEVPKKWRDKNYPREFPQDGGKQMINKLKEDDKKYLRVYYEVLDRYVREKFKYEEEHIDVLKEIRDGLRDSRGGSSGGGSSASAGGSSGGSGAGSASGTAGGTSSGVGRSGGGLGT